MTAVSARGATLVELLVALMLALVAAAGLAIVAGDARAVFVSQPEASNLLQRARVSFDLDGPISARRAAVCAYAQFQAR